MSPDNDDNKDDDGSQNHFSQCFAFAGSSEDQSDSCLSATISRKRSPTGLVKSFSPVHIALIYSSAIAFVLIGSLDLAVGISDPYFLSVTAPIHCEYLHQAFVASN